MITGSDLKTLLYKDCGGNLKQYKAVLRSMFGISHNPNTNSWEVSPKARWSPDEFSVRSIYESFMGQEFLSEMATGNGQGDMADSTYDLIGGNGLQPGVHTQSIKEDASPVTADAFGNISAVDASVGGLIQARMISAYKAPSYIRNEFMRSEPTVTEGGKVILIPESIPGAEVVGEDEEFPDLGLQEQWIWAGKNMVVGDSVSVTRRAVVYNLTGDILAKAEGRARGLSDVQEYYCAAHILGLTLPLMPNTLTSFPFKKSIYDQISLKYRLNEVNPSATANATYQATATAQGTSTAPNAYNFINLITGQGGFADWTSLIQVRNLLTLARHPLTNMAFDSDINKLWCHTNNFDQVQRALHSSQVFMSTGTPATAPYQGSASTFPPVMTGSPGWPQNSLLNGWSAYRSAIWDQVVVDQGKTTALAAKWWLAGNPQKCFCWRSAWDLMVQQAAPQTADLLKKNIVYMAVGQFSGQLCVEEPRYVVLLTD